MYPSLFLLIIAGLLGACGGSPPATAYEQLDRLLDTARGPGTLERTRAIVVVSEEGCMPCNRKLAEAMGEALDDTTALFVVSAMGAGVDISPFLDRPGQVIWDRKENLRKSGILSGSGAIFLSDGRIDTIIPVQLEGLQERLEAIAERLNAR